MWQTGSIREKKSVMDVLLIQKKIKSEKRRYKDSEQKNPETAKLNKSQTIKKTFENLKTNLPFRRLRKFLYFHIPCSAHIYNSVHQKIPAS